MVSYWDKIVHNLNIIMGNVRGEKPELAKFEISRLKGSEKPSD